MSHGSVLETGPCRRVRNALLLPSRGASSDRCCSQVRVYSCIQTILSNPSNFPAFPRPKCSVQIVDTSSRGRAVKVSWIVKFRPAVRKDWPTGTRCRVHQNRIGTAANEAKCSVVGHSRGRLGMLPAGWREVERRLCMEDELERQSVKGPRSSPRSDLGIALRAKMLS